MTYTIATERFISLIVHRLKLVVKNYPSAKEAAEDLGISASSICRLSQGKGIPTHEDMIKLFGEDLHDVELPESDEDFEIMQIENEMSILNNRLEKLKKKKAGKNNDEF